MGSASLRQRGEAASLIVVTNPLRLACFGGLALLVAGCKPKPKCDEAKLGRAETLLDGEASRQQLHEAAELLGDACTLGEGVVNGLLDEHGNGARIDYIYSKDEEHSGLLREFCADPKGASEASERRDDAGVYAACELSQFNLMKADEYRARHKAAFVALFALEKAGVESERAQAIARSFIDASAPPPGVALFPESTSDVGAEMMGFGREESIAIRADALVSGDTSVVLVDGLVADPKSHVIGPLKNELRGRADAVPELFADEAGAVFVGAHADTPVKTLVDAIYTAAMTNHDRATLAVHNRGEPRRLPIDLPARWTIWLEEGEVSPDTRPAQIVARLSEGELVLSNRGGEELGRAKSGDAPAIEALAREGASQIDDDKLAGIVEIGVAANVSVRSLVETVDALRGRDCSLRSRYMSEDKVESCLLWKVQLDSWPPVPRREGAWKDFEFELSSGADLYDRKGSHKPKQLQEMVEAAVPQIRACLEESPDALAWKPDYIGFAFADDEKGLPEVSISRNRGVPSECVEKALGLGTVDRDRLGLVYADVTIELEVPGPKEGTADEG